MNDIKTVATINNVSILLIENGEKFVPIRPICDALGIDEDTQRRKINNDEILGSTATLRVAVAGDKKKREMTCLPFMFIFGWIFTINPKNVKPEAKEALIKYKLECYQALFKHFTDQSEFLEQKQIETDKRLAELDSIRSDFRNTKQKLDEARKKFNEVREMTFEDWQANNNQMKMNFE